MAPPLRVFLSSDGVRTLLGQLTFQQIIVGRESPDGFTIPSNAVSREHGIFLSIGEHWFFKDLGSTNGTWLNDKLVPPSSLTHLKVGDVLQLGDSLLELLPAEVGEIPQGRTSALVFLRGNYAGEFFMPESGPVLIIGGPKAHLKKEVAGLELPGLVIERRGTDLTAFSIDPKAQALLNGQPLRFATNVVDRDILAIQSYTVHISIEDDIKKYSSTIISIENDSATISSGGVALKDWDEDMPKRVLDKTHFGKIGNADDEVGGLGKKLFAQGLEQSQEDAVEKKMQNIELLLIVGVGGVLLLVLLVLVVYFMSR